MTKDEDRSNNGDKCEPKTAMSVVTNVVQLSIYAVDIAINQYSSFSGICIGLAVSLFVATELFSWLYYFPSTNLDYPSVPLTIFWHLLIGVIIFCLGFTLNHSNLPVTNYYFLIRVPLLFNQFSSFVNVYAMMQTPLLANKLPFINYAFEQIFYFEYFLMAFLIALAADFLAFGQRINEYLLISYSVFFVVYYAVKIATRQQLFNSLLKLLLSE